MNTSGLRLERRSETRHGPAPERISWAHMHAERICTAWIRDVAASSLAFLTPTRDEPAPGETLELTFGAGGPSPQHLRMRVARTSPYDRFFSLVACQTDLATKYKQQV